MLPQRGVTMIFDHSKKGQGISINVIIIAALALIVLVVLVMVFTGRIAVFERGVSQEGKAELTALRIMYGDCRPTAAAESAFDRDFGAATSVDAKEAAKIRFQEEIARCKSTSNDKSACEANSGCRWG